MNLFSYWSGPVSWMEHASINSILALGYDLTVFSFEPERLAAADLRCRVADAREVIDASLLESFHGLSPAHLTDHFRLEAIAQGRGTWTDLDNVFLRRLPEEPYLFGWSNAKTICNSVLRLPPESALLTEYRTICRQGREQGVRQLPAWYPWSHQLMRHLRDMIQQRRSTPIYGPRTLTHLVHKHGLAHLAQPCAVFNPIPPDKAMVADLATSWPPVSSDTACVHLWRSLWKQDQRTTPPIWALRYIPKDCKAEVGITEAA